MPTATVARNDPAGTNLRLLELDAPLDGYTRPGQYVTVAVQGHEPAFFAVASAPGAPAQLLVKREGEPAVHLSSLEPGARIPLSEPLGRGFALERAEGHELVVLCTGSGISACRPVVLGEVARGLPRPVHLYYGVLTPGHRSFLSDLEAWGNAGVKVHTVVGAPLGTGWRGATGFVQDVAGAHGLIRQDVAVLLAGVPAMVDQARVLFRAAGVPEERLLLNF